MSIFENNRGLLERFRVGEHEVLAQVYRRYVDDVAILARRGFTTKSQGQVYVTGGNADQEHEIVQETFMRAFSEKARVSYDGLRPYRPFLLRIAKNLMIDKFRERRKEGGGNGKGVGDIDVLLESNAEFSVNDTPDQELHWKRLGEATSEFLAGLEKEIREIVRLRFEEELSQDSVAETLQCSRRKVRSTEKRVQKQLQRYLKSRGFLED